MNDQLIKAIEKLLDIKGQCYLAAIDDLDSNQLTLTQISYLKVIGQMEMTTSSGLSETLNISKPTVTEIIKKLEKTGFVEKMPCPSDGRVSYIKLSPKGMKLATVEQRSIANLVGRLTQNLSQADQEALISIIDSI